MAEKKFFVDINLQGNKLSNAVVGQNTAMTTGGAFQYNANDTRLEYFNGSATQQVANLSDIQAVTGGLIFQGGYDASTNTPDITDGTASKGFFWVVTTAGSFLGDSVQIGDSLIAKVDEAGTTLADWIILQGNVVIATDTVDGISRLATQTEANAGTESGAVVITPATLQGKIDAQITPEINNKLPLAGGTMSGDINMGANDITNVHIINTLGVNATGGVNTQNLYPIGDNTSLNVGGDLDFQNSHLPTNLPAPTNGGDAANKTYVDDNTSNKLPLAGGTMSGDINMDGNSVNGARYVYTDNIDSSNGTSDVGVYTNLDFKESNLPINLPAPTNGGDATNKNYVDGVGATAESNANAYTDAEIKSQSFTGLINGSDSGASNWVFLGVGLGYQAIILTGLGANITYNLNYTNGSAEFDSEVGIDGSINLYSNIEPLYPVKVNAVKTGGNL